MFHRFLLTLFAFAALCGVAFADDADKYPEGQLRLPCKITEVYDGDTITVEVTIPIKVRLLDCWAPEVTGSEKEQGIISRDHLRKIALNQKGLLVVPINGTVYSIGDLFSFNRILGRVLIGHPQRDLSEIQVEAGQATKHRVEKE